MKLSVNWLKRFVDIPESVSELADMLTMIGLEAEVDRDLSILKNVITTRIESVEPHPNADKLNICKVIDGTETYSVVCGASNVEQGQIVPFARVGAVLPGKIKIKKAKIRGEVSFGMLCSERELGISEEHEGILILPNEHEIGIDIGEILNPLYASVEIDVTPNRPDALSHIGVAREIALKTGRPLKLPTVQIKKTKQPSHSIEVHIKNADGCPRYLAGIMKNLTIGPSPRWMKEYLLAAGQRSINNLVDISNYILLEMGHPTHVFDFQAVRDKKIEIRFAKKGEELITLDGEKRSLDSSHLLITDGVKPLALAGIMGGESSGVTNGTTEVLIESAYFDPITIRKGSKSLGLLTEASRRFERGADPEAVATAFYRIVDLLEQYAGGELASEVVDSYPKPVKINPIHLNIDEINLVAGISFSTDFIESTLSGLEIHFEKTDSKNWICNPPGFRPDLEREIDLIEEMIRVYGYDRIPAKQHFSSIFLHNSPDPQKNLSYFIHELKGLGFRQCVNNSLESELSAAISKLNPVKMINPLNNQMSVLRTSLYPGLIQNLNYNIKNGNKNLALFETGNIHYQTESGFKGIQEKHVLSGVVTGLFQIPSVHDPVSKTHSFFTLKGQLETLLCRISGTGIKFVKTNNPEFQICYNLMIKGMVVGCMGEISANISKTLKTNIENIFGFTLDVNELIRFMNEPRTYQAVTVYPTISRDLNFVMDEEIETIRLQQAMLKLGQGILKTVKPEDVFRHKSLGDKKKSVMFNLVFQHVHKTLEDSEISPIVETIITKVKNQFGAVLRD